MISSAQPFQKHKAVELIIQAALHAVDPHQVVRNSMQMNGSFLQIQGKSVDLASYEHVFLIAIGKASQKMTKAGDDLFGNFVTKSIVLSKHIDPSVQLPNKYELITGGHPVPTLESMLAARKILDLAKSAGKNDLVLFFISGGGSALMTLPEDGITLVEMQDCSRLLLASGADIHEFNAVRKHLDQVKGGKLALAASPAVCFSCILSDVVGSSLSSIASGPTVPDPTTFIDACDVIKKYKLSDRLPESIGSVLQKGMEKKIPETLKPNLLPPASFSNFLLAENRTAAEAAASEAQKHGFHTLILTTSLTGEASQAGKFLASILKEMTRENAFLKKPALVIAGGETTVTLKGKGIGGRNLETALGAVESMRDLDHVALITLATDGEDGPTDAAGAIVTGKSWQEGLEKGLDVRLCLEKNDSYTYFHKIQGLIQPGVTGTNVNDLNFLFSFADQDL